jgi:ParB/RepB/Spo0J family partition protein
MTASNIDLHLIDQKYAHTRILDAKTISDMIRSLDQFGQISPVSLTPQYVLIDGYIRVTALTKLGNDTAMACIFDLQEQAALFQFLADQNKKTPRALEQAALIAELKACFDLSLAQIAKGLGKDKSWVKRRLDLITSLPADILDLVRAGHISTWSATRILAPLARANREHAQELCKYLVAQSLSTRELKIFFDFYQKATRKVRENMIHNPGLFLQVKKQKDEEAGLQGPEKNWFDKMKLVSSVLYRLAPQTSAVFASLSEKSRPRFQGVLERSDQFMNDIVAEANKGIDHALTTNQGNHPPDASKGRHNPTDLQAAGREPEHSAQSALCGP